MRMNVFINPISKIYLGTKVDSGLFHTAHFVSCNNKFLKEKLNRLGIAIICLKCT